MERHQLKIKQQTEIEITEKKKEIYTMKTKMMFEMTINNILNPLLEIVYEYKASSSYNYVPYTNEDSEDGQEYYGKKFNEIFKALNANIFLSERQYAHLYSVIEGLFSFTRKYESADGLPDLFLEANENLNYYLLAFTVPKEDRELFKEKVIGMPNEEEMSIADSYHKELQRKSEELNLHFDEDDFFMDELAYAVRNLVQTILIDE